MKPLNSRKKEDLMELFIKLNIDLPEPDAKGQITKPRLLAVLAEHGVDNKKLLTFEQKEREDANRSKNTFDGMVVVCMDRQNASYRFDRYTFTRDKRYVLMPVEDSKKLIDSSSGFRVAAPQEIEAYYR